MKRCVVISPLLLVLLLFLTGSAVQAQSAPASASGDTFLNKRLQEMAAVLQTRYHIDCTASMPGRVEGCELLANRDAFGQISHIGFRLFDRTLMEQNPSPVYHFVERYLLELCLTESDTALRQMLKEDKVTLTEGGNRPVADRRTLVALLAEIARCESLLVTTDNNYYTVTWNIDRQTRLFLRFPIQYELLWGMNKIEMESLFLPRLTDYCRRDTVVRPLPQVDLRVLQPLADSCWVYEGEAYATESMNSNRYYRRQGGQLLPLHDMAHPVESVCNLFTLQAGKEVRASVTQRLYSRKKETFDVPLDGLLGFCRSMGCEVFVGIETVEKHRVSGMAIVLNRAEGYNHVIYFDADMRMLQLPERYKMSMELYAYIPMHNIANLYSDKKNNK